MCQLRWLRLPGALALGFAGLLAACDRPDPVAMRSSPGLRVASSVVSTPGGDLSITTVPLQVPSGYTGKALDVNNAGVIVGYYHTPFTYTTSIAVRWDLAGVMTELPLPDACGGGPARAYAVNQVGDVAGMCSVRVGDEWVTKAVLWPKGGAAVVLPPPSGYPDATARDVNNRGDVIGSAFVGDLRSPVIWSKGLPTVLELPSGYPAGDADFINDGGLIAGGTAEDPVRSLLWTRGAPQLLALPDGWTGCFAMDITEAGTTLGYAYRSEPYANLPLLWDRNGNATAIPIGMAASDPMPYGISGGNWVVGAFGACPAEATCGFLWSAATGTVALSFPGTTAPSASNISDTGYIVGQDSYAMASGPALLWIVTLTPPPTP